MANDDVVDKLSDTLTITTAAVLALLEEALDRQDASNTQRVTLLQNLHSELTAAKARLGS